MGHIYTVELRFHGERLFPPEIAARWGFKPSLEKFQAPQNRLRGQEACWGFNGQGESGFRQDWTSLEAGLQFLLNVLSPKKADIMALSHQWTACWWCAHFQSSFDGGPLLSAKPMSELGSYGLPLYLDTYFGQ